MAATVSHLTTRRSIDELAAAEANARAAIVTDWLNAPSPLARLAAEYLARMVDASTTDGPRLMDEIHALANPTAA